jgi:CheY-like chemotaxis protein
MGSVLIVDDVAGSARLIASLLAPEGYALRTAASFSLTTQASP